MAINSSEQFVYDICKKSFLSLWSYINPQGKDSGTELCDILVVCDPHIIVISVKDVALGDSGDVETDWGRWHRKAIENSEKQANGAIRWLKNAIEVVKKDGSRGIPLPPLDRRVYHRIGVAFGGNREVPITSGTANEKHMFHVMDEISFKRLLEQLDTINDFVGYLVDKETHFSGERRLFYRGEEDLLVMYLQNERCFSSNADILILADDMWERFISRPEVIAKQEEDQISYVWDRLIELMCRGGFDGNNWGGPGLSESEQALRILALEDRFNRRMLGSALYDFLEKSKTGEVGARCCQSRSGVGYVFYTYTTDSTIEERRHRLVARCYASLCHLQECTTVVGIGMNVPGETPVGGYSQELVVLKAKDGKWSPEDLENAKYCHNELGYFKKPNETQTHFDEYPIGTNEKKN